MHARPWHSFLLCIHISFTSAHGSINIPLPRNNAGQYPLNTTQGASHGPSCLGDACGWFAAGCFINCEKCTNASSGAYVPSYPPSQGCTSPQPTLPDAFRTYNRELKSPLGDWTLSHPWRSPGKAPNHDACGLSGAYSVGPGVSGYPPLYPGSQIAPQTVPVTWPAGGVAEAAWSIWSNHGGGYTYRLCPSHSNPTEECFQSQVLNFATNTTTIRSPWNEFADFDVPARDVNIGTHPLGSAWRMNPIPACNCDIGYNCTLAEGGGVHSAYERANGLFPCETGYQFPPPWSSGFGYWGSGAHYRERLYFTMVDKLAVPSTPGQYILSWRWDAENSPQVWGNCADIQIV